MKQKEQWAKEETAKIFEASLGMKLDIGSIWLAGFEYAKDRCSDVVCSCCSNPQECLEVGEYDPDKKKAIKDMEPAIFTVGVTRLEDK